MIMRTENSVATRARQAVGNAVLLARREIPQAWWKASWIRITRKTRMLCGEEITQAENQEIRELDAHRQEVMQRNTVGGADEKNVAKIKRHHYQSEVI